MVGSSVPICLTSLLAWPAKRWIVASLVALGTALLIGIPTAIIDNPVFGRAVAPADWSIPILVVTAILSGLLGATYVRIEAAMSEERSFKIGGAGGLLSFFAVGCPVCNKIVLVALGASGAMQYFAPVQPYLAAAGLFLLTYAVRRRLIGESMCALEMRKLQAEDIR